MIKFKTRVNVAEEMISSATELTQQEAALLEDANAILAESEREEIKMLSSMGLSHALEFKNKIDSQRKELDGLDVNRIFTKRAVRAICLKYRLTIGRVDSYCGSISPTLPRKLLELESRIGSLRKERLYIVAPHNQFEELLREDPMAFYLLKSGDFYLVDKWGDDLVVTPWRRVRNLAKRTWITGLIASVPFTCAYLFVLRKLCAQYDIVTGFVPTGPDPRWIIPAVLGCLFISVAFMIESTASRWNSTNF